MSIASVEHGHMTLWYMFRNPPLHLFQANPYFQIQMSYFHLRFECVVSTAALENKWLQEVFPLCSFCLRIVIQII